MSECYRSVTREVLNQLAIVNASVTSSFSLPLLAITEEEEITEMSLGNTSGQERTIDIHIQNMGSNNSSSSYNRAILDCENNPALISDQIHLLSLQHTIQLLCRNIMFITSEEANLITKHCKYRIRVILEGIIQEHLVLIIGGLVLAVMILFMICAILLGYILSQMLF